MSRTHYHVKSYAPKRVAVNGAVFDKVKRVLFYTTTKAISKRPKSNQLVESGHLMSPLKHSHHRIRLTLRSFRLRISEVKCIFKITTRNSLLAMILFLKSNLCIAMTGNIGI